MDKPSLLQRLSTVRARAEAAHLEVVIQTSLVSQAVKQGQRETDLMALLSYWKMTEQKLLRELEWILDQLNKAAHGSEDAPPSP